MWETSELLQSTLQVRLVFEGHGYSGVPLGQRACWMVRSYFLGGVVGPGELVITNWDVDFRSGENYKNYSFSSQLWGSTSCGNWRTEEPWFWGYGLWCSRHVLVQWNLNLYHPIIQQNGRLSAIFIVYVRSNKSSSRSVESLEGYVLGTWPAGVWICPFAGYGRWLPLQAPFFGYEEELALLEHRSRTVSIH